MANSDDLFSDEEYRMMGEALQMAAPLPPGLDWDYFNDPRNELGDTENPAVDAVFDWGQPLIGARGRRPPSRDPKPDCSLPDVTRGGIVRRLPVPLPGASASARWREAMGRVGMDSTDYEICERMVPPGSEAVVSGGERFRRLVRVLRARGARNPEALAAYIGRKKYGAQRFAAMAAAGRR